MLLAVGPLIIAFLGTFLMLLGVGFDIPGAYWIGVGACAVSLIASIYSMWESTRW